MCGSISGTQEMTLISTATPMMIHVKCNLRAQLFSPSFQWESVVSPLQLLWCRKLCKWEENQTLSVSVFISAETFR